MNIGEVSKTTGLSLDTLRYYEKIGIVNNVERTSGGKRIYSQQNIDQINFISCMKKAGCSLEVIKEYMKLYEAGDATRSERIELLEGQKEKLLNKVEEINSSIDYLTSKIKYTKNHKEK